ncbi:hypothetical protein TA3x_003334 [Tundrisphaera sp. TA3]|uniref:hypothetical protein n=1 Tax=Tundrisphaera sp. TA3 TaxID=3435775 RepID=UPI003EB852E5
MTWNLAEAKDRLVELVDLALTEGPQTITRRDDTFVLMTGQQYIELTGRATDFKEFLLEGIGLDELDLSRDRSPGRDVPL